MNDKIATLRLIGNIEGWSYLILLFVAAAAANRWNYSFSAMAFVASLVPWGTFLLNKKLARM